MRRRSSGPMPRQRRTSGASFSRDSGVICSKRSRACSPRLEAVHHALLEGAALALFERLPAVEQAVAALRRHVAELAQRGAPLALGQALEPGAKRFGRALEAARPGGGRARPAQQDEREQHVGQPACEPPAHPLPTSSSSSSSASTSSTAITGRSSSSLGSTARGAGAGGGCSTISTGAGAGAGARPAARVRPVRAARRRGRRLRDARLLALRARQREQRERRRGGGERRGREPAPRPARRAPALRRARARRLEPRREPRAQVRRHGPARQPAQSAVHRRERRETRGQLGRARDLIAQRRGLGRRQLAVEQGRELLVELGVHRVSSLFASRASATRARWISAFTDFSLVASATATSA